MPIEQISEAPRIYRIDGFNGEKHPDLEKKLVPQKELSLLGEVLRQRKRRVAFTTGTYDMIHIGHGRYLELARSLGDILVVGLNSDVSVRAYKGPNRPILEEYKRAEMLVFLSAVDYITFYDEPTAEGVIRLLKPHKYLCVEGSWPEGTELKDKLEVVAMAEHDGEIYLAPRQAPGLSTSKIVEKLTADGQHATFTELRAILDSYKEKLPSLQTL